MSQSEARLRKRTGPRSGGADTVAQDCGTGTAREAPVSQQAQCAAEIAEGIRGDGTGLFDGGAEIVGFGDGGIKTRRG